MRKAPVTTALLVLICIVFAFEVLTGAFNSDQAMIAFGAIVPDTLARRDYWRLITAMFLHAGWLHWATNTWALYQLGTLYEALFGSRRFAITYFVSGICASIASVMFSQTISVGASGAIFGILGAFVFSLLRSQYRHQRWTKGLLYQIVVLGVVNIAIGFSVKFIDNAAHIGGLVAGLLLGLIPHRVPPPSPRDAVIDVGSDPMQNQAHVLRSEQPFVDDGHDSPNRG
jgi:rhomboid protease GluP